MGRWRLAREVLQAASMYSRRPAIDDVEPK
jgi:hypothetical protein